MKNNERLIQFFDIQIKGKTTSKNIDFDISPPRTLEQLMTEFITLRDLNLARVKFKSTSKQEYLLADFEDLPDCWVLLINVVDADAAHLVTNKIGGSDEDRKVISLNDGRGLESSAHLIIYKEKDAFDKHLVLFERGHNVPFAKAISFINELLKQSARLSWDLLDTYKKADPTGELGAAIKLYCSMSYYAHPSDEFFEELESGTLTGIYLTSDCTNLIGYDSGNNKNLKDISVNVDISKLAVTVSGGNVKHLNKSIKDADSLNFPSVRVSFKDSTGPGHSATFSTDTGNMISTDKYVKKRRIEGFGNSLQTAFAIINDSIIEKMRSLY